MAETYVDKSAFTTLSNVNMEETMKGEDAAYMSGYMAGQNSRQKEIDAELAALKFELAAFKGCIAGLAQEREGAQRNARMQTGKADALENQLAYADLEFAKERSEMHDRAISLVRENDALKAENERLRKDAKQFAVLLKAFMFSEIQSREELDAGKSLIQKYAASSNERFFNN